MRNEEGKTRTGCGETIFRYFGILRFWDFLLIAMIAYQQIAQSQNPKIRNKGKFCKIILLSSSLPGWSTLLL
jgi:hypothetical protein